MYTSALQRAANADVNENLEDPPLGGRVVELGGAVALLVYVGVPVVPKVLHYIRRFGHCSTQLTTLKACMGLTILSGTRRCCVIIELLAFPFALLFALSFTLAFATVFILLVF